MQRTSLLLAALLAAPVLVPRQARAASSDYEDLDAPSGKAKKKHRERKKRDLSSEEVREIVRGFYAKTNIGSWMYLGRFRSPYVRPGTALALAVGQDFVDHERNSMAWEVSFFQGIHNGMNYESQAQVGGPYIEGDLRTYTLLGLLEYSIYPTRRLGAGLRAGGGVLYSPLLMDDQYYASDVLSEWGMASDPGYHDSPHPAVVAGPTFEYYAKMAHFSLGLDTDFIYAVGFDYGLSITGTLKYTF